MVERGDGVGRTGTGVEDDVTRLREATSRTTSAWSSSAVKGAATEIGDVLAHTYQLEALLGRGGMGAVYRARHVALGTEHAIKVILPEYAHDPFFVALIEREARALHRVRDEAVVEYQGLFLDEEGRRYLVMEFVAGEPLSAAMRKRALGVDEVRRLKRRLARGLAAAHAQGVFHRDLSPENVLLPGGEVDAAKIIDFGIAKSTDAASGPTLVGSEFAGKYSYVSPEQVGLNRGAVDARSDIYSLGLVLAAAALGHGRKLNMGDSPVSVVETRKSVPDLSGIPEELRPELRAMLQPRPENRPQSMAALAAEAVPAPLARRWRPIVVGAASGAVALAGVAFFLLSRPDSPQRKEPVAVAVPTVPEQAGRPSQEPKVEDLIARLSKPEPTPEPAAKDAAAVSTPPAEPPSPALPAPPAPAPPQPTTVAEPQQAILPQAATLPAPVPAAPLKASAEPPEPPMIPAPPVSAPAALLTSSSPPAPPSAQEPTSANASSEAAMPAGPALGAAAALEKPVEKEQDVASRRETTPTPPIQPVPTDAGVAAALGDIDCGALSPATGREGIRLAGILPSAADAAAVVRKLELRYPGIAVASDARVVGRPFCAPLAALWRTGAINATGIPRIALAKKSWHDGEAFVFEVVSSAPSLVFLDASLIDAEGTVVHLLPTRKTPDASIAPGASKRIGAERGKGDEIFEVAPPYGANLLIVLAADSPLFGAPRPQVEKLDDYLPVLEKSLGKTPARASWTMVETLPR